MTQGAAARGRVTPPSTLTRRFCGRSCDRESNLGRTEGTRKWLGASDAFATLRWLGLNVKLYDVDAPSGPVAAAAVMGFAQEHFAGSTRGEAGTPTVSPIYLQFQGHSQTIVGAVCRGAPDEALLIWDPAGRGGGDVARAEIDVLARHRQYQLLTVEPGAVSKATALLPVTARRLA